MANLVTTDKVTWTEGVFHGGSFSRWGNRPGKYVGDRTVTGTICRSGYGRETTSHWLTILVESSSGVEPAEVGRKLRRKAATVYGGLKHAEDGADHAGQEAVKREQKMLAAQNAEFAGNHFRAEQLLQQAARVA
jgi:hypothetical protein